MVACSKKAAQSAGIGPVKLIKEPEAAALYTLHYMGDKGLDVGDAFVICDAGGGTVDLISYEIMSLQPFELKELVKASGAWKKKIPLGIRYISWHANSTDQDSNLQEDLLVLWC